MHGFRAPVSSDKVLEYGQQSVPTLALATVYRNMKILAGEGALSEVALPCGR